MRRWSRRFTRNAADHERARELASTRMDEALTAGEAAWLEAHLDRCDACRQIAAAYESQRAALRTLFAQGPEPPRDLWARTAAAMDASRRPAGPRSRLTGSVSLAPIAGLLVIAIVVGAGLFNGTLLLPSVGGTAQGDGAEATPIALAAGELQVVSRGEDGRVEIRSRSLDEVCPLDASSCGVPTGMDVTQSTSLAGSSALDAIISPGRDRLIVVERGDGPQSVYVLPVSQTVAGGSSSPSSPRATGTVTTPPDASTASPRSTPTAGTPSPTPAEKTPTVTDRPSSAKPDHSIAPPSSDSDSATPSATEPAGSASPTPESGSPAVEPTPVDQAGPTGSPGTTADASSPPPAGPESPPLRTPEANDASPTPAVAVTPGPKGAIEIAHDVTVVGADAAYSPDGTRFAFSARPAGGAIGPDVYVWHVGASMATAVTSDHGSVFTGWLGSQLLISRVVNGSSVTLAISPDSGMVQQIGVRPMWRPTVAPGGDLAVWWDGTMARAADGLTWAPDTGRLIVAAWPDAGGPVKVLATDPLTDWDARWDGTGTMLAVWVTVGRSGSVGQLSLYAINPDTGLPDLAHPKLADAPAYAGFSLDAGRLVWSAPDASGDTSVQVLAWDGSTVGRLELPTGNGSTVVR